MIELKLLYIGVVLFLLFIFKLFVCLVIFILDLYWFFFDVFFINNLIWNLKCIFGEIFINILYLYFL